LRQARHLWLLAALAVLAPACGPSNHNNKPPNTLASAPTSLVATVKSTARIDLTWIPGSTNEFEFRIERSEDGGLTYAQVGAVPRGSTMYSDLGLLPNKTYTYRVTAWNSVGNSPYAGPAAAITTALVWKTSTGGPGIRADHTAIYDSLGRRMILFGGQDDFFTFYNDVWALDLTPTTAAMTTPPVNYWTQLAPTGVPPNAPTPRFGHSAIYDTQNNRMIVFGGEDGTSSPFQQDVYILNLGTIPPAWSKPAVSGTAPSPRLGHTAVYDAANQRMVVFGGNDLTGEKSDTFFLSLPLNPPFVWSNGPSGPIKRTEHSAVYDGMRQQMIIFGGLDHATLPDGSILNEDTWFLNLAGTPSWNQPFLSGAPFFRQGHTTVYDSSNQRLVLFGGDTQFSPSPVANNELWAVQLDAGSSWTFLSPSSGAPPTARYGHSAIYDTGSGRMVIYGGYDSSIFPAFQDTVLSDF